MKYYKALTTCQRRGFELIDKHIWQVTRGHEHLGYVKNDEPCDPPQYIDLGVGERADIMLPPGATVIDSKPVKEKILKASTVFSIEDVIASLNDLVKQRDTLLDKVKELEETPKGPDVKLVDRWRLQFRWNGSAWDLEQEWGFTSKESAEERYKKWVDTFGDKFEDVEIVQYQINESSDLQYPYKKEEQ